MEIPAWLAPYEPQIPLSSLVVEVNKIYHSFDAKHYDREHPEIHQQLPAIWAEMIQQLPERPSWRILDFGCGTGFEAQQILDKLGDQIELLIAYDPSDEMLAQCKLRLHRFPKVIFCGQLHEAGVFARFNLLITNSLLHHLPNFQETISSIVPGLTKDAFWLAGHEPSSRYYRNAECLSFLQDYSSHRDRLKWFEPSSYLAKLSMLLGKHPLSATAKVVYDRGLFKRIPSPSTVNKIVDFHVAHSPEEASQGRGLDFENMQEQFGSVWSLRWLKTYGYFGGFNPIHAPEAWKDRSRRLAGSFPNDGTNFSSVWSRQ
ncbi:MAG TPA: methyltransferase [Candidatus Angelobacter sp.]|nr:methyltransferase [Candidatus Angelobacter sp.]